MNLNRVMWGIILLFVGLVLLLDNFEVIEFYWRNVWAFWPVFLIISGVNILFNRNKSQVGNSISLGVLVLMLCLVFYKGQQPPAHKYWIGDKLSKELDMDFDIDKDKDDRPMTKMNFTEPFNTADLKRKAVLNMTAGGTTIDLKGATDSLIEATVQRRKGNFMLQRESSDSVTTLTFKMKDESKGWSVGDSGNDVALRMNKTPEWDLNLNLGAGNAELDLSEYKVRSFNFDGGVASVDIKIGSLLPITDVKIKTGLATVKISVPKESGCRIKSKVDLSAKEFSNFIKIDNGNYETANYAQSKHKIFINLDGGLSNFEVEPY